ncbi:MAG: tetratricopeptide repeat protein [Gammaproteobacteria bacterium]|jgi:TPR repeat protein
MVLHRPLSYHGWLLIINLTICPLYTFAAAAPDSEFSKALAAYQHSDYRTAERAFKKLAAQGQAEAQRLLGRMFDKGQGVPQNYRKAVAWYRRAAERRDPAAQYYLGLKYANGHGVKKNPSQAYIWFAISFNNGYEMAARPLRVLNRSMSTRDRQKALQAVVQLMEKYGK